MASYFSSYDTRIPPELVDLMVQTMARKEEQLQTAETFNNSGAEIRDSKVSWVQDSEWVAGLCYHYVLKANRANFRYDIDGFDDGTLQYTYYSTGGHYSWHSDQGLLSHAKPLDRVSSTPDDVRREEFVNLGSEKVRKLSFSLQLSDPTDYTGGELQIMNDDGTILTLPREKGRIVIFDSRTLHRVRKVTSGQRRVVVGWVAGPRWR